FVFGRSGGIDHRATWRSAIKGRFFREVRELPVQEYDVVINDFEPVSAWAAYLRGVPCIGSSHQAAVLKPDAPRPSTRDPFGVAVLRHYAPVDASVGFHFHPYDADTFTPVVRRQIRGMTTRDEGHYTVYLPAYDDARILATLSRCPQVRWEVFSKHVPAPVRKDHVTFHPLDGPSFAKSMASSTGVLCGAGFETPAEALFLGKKLMVVPMTGQYEQQCNAAALSYMGVHILDRLGPERSEQIGAWIGDQAGVQVDYPDQTQMIVDAVLERSRAVQAR
ncbi:MAG: glycosyl transferase, partial [Flavobacteriales bacterium]|nr:glycosyl transferase [Flavobacteriales bacterium]